MAKPKKAKPDDREFDLHVWKQPEDENTSATYTVSIGNRAICHYMPIDEALDSIREEMESEG
jgi:hypothetical protein